MDIKVRATEIQRSNSFSFAAGTTRIERWISWTAPIWPWVKLNSNNAKKSSGIAGAGGLIRDFRGVWHVPLESAFKEVLEQLSLIVKGEYEFSPSVSQRCFRFIRQTLVNLPVAEIRSLLDDVSK
ncbi:hypothetical protein WN943_026363 [Citrus x changshan-huyou]